MTVSQLKKRAIGAEGKSERRAAIVRAAAALSSQDVLVSMDSLARKCGLAKGTLYLYFRSREELLLAVHEKQTHEVFDVVEKALAAPGADAQSVLKAGMRYLKAHSEFYPLAANCRYMLDTNVSMETALAFKLGIGRRLDVLGRGIESLYKGMKSGEGAALLMNSYALIIGLWQQADTPACLREVMQRPDMKIFRIDYEKQLSGALLDLWEAAGRRRR
jgi:AcrR family transcriptional regulator